jgi:hypothetical protein
MAARACKPFLPQSIVQHRPLSILIIILAQVPACPTPTEFARGGQWSLRPVRPACSSARALATFSLQQDKTRRVEGGANPWGWGSLTYCPPPTAPSGRLPQGGMDCYRVRLPSALRRKRGTLALRSKNRSTMNTRRPKRAQRVAAGSRGRRASDVAAAAVCAGGGVPALSAAALSTQPHSTLKQLRRHPRFPRITSRHLTTARPCSG